MPSAASRPKRLLPQLGGFEGVACVPVALQSPHLPLVEVHHPRQWNSRIQAAAPAASTEFAESDQAIPEVPDLVNSPLDVLPCLLGILPVFAEPI
jgi:hypothetical protein